MKKKYNTIMKVCLGAFALFLAGQSFAQDVNAYTANPTDDCYVRLGENADNNYSSDAILRVKQSLTSAKNSRSTYLKYDLKGASVENITNAYVKIYSYYKAGDETQITAYGTDDNWEEATITYNNAPANGDSLVSVGDIQKGAWVTFDISDYVIAQLAASDSIISIHLDELAFTGVDLRFYSKEAENYWPVLLVADGVDSVAPATPEKLEVTSFTDTTISLAWDAATDLGGGLYTVFVDGDVAQVSTTTSYLATGLTADTYYDFSVLATDLFGNESELANITVSTVSKYTSTYDLYTRDGASADKNYASDEYVRVKDGSEDFARKGHLQFNISYFDLDAASVAKAKLKLYCFKENTAGTVLLHGVDNNEWTDTISWNTAPTVSDSTIASDTLVAKDEWAVFDVTDYIKSKVASDTVLSFTLTSNTGTDVRFYGSENWEKRPMLYILGDDTEAPTIPAIVSAVADTLSIELSWDKSTDSVGVENYALYVNDDQVATVDATVYNYTFEGLGSGTTYELGVSAIDLIGNETVKDSVIVMTLGGTDTVPPAAPTDLEALNVSMFSAAISWTPSTDDYAVKGYVLSVNSDSIETLTDTATYFSFINLIPNTEYNISLVAFDAAGNVSEPGTLMFKTVAPPDYTPPSTPGNLIANNVTSSSVDLIWEASVDNVSSVTYDIYNGETKLANITDTTYSVTDLEASKEYTFSVVAVDKNSNASDAASVVVNTITGVVSNIAELVKTWSVDNTIYVNIPTNTTATVSIYNALGSLVYTSNVYQEQNEINDITTNGIYFVKTAISSKAVVNKIIIE